MLFSDIYTKSIALFDDPKITTAYNTNQIQFYKLMYTYMQNAIAMFQNPTMVGVMLSSYTEAKGQLETFAATGTTKTFTTQLEPPEGSILQFVEHDLIVEGQYNSATQEVTFPDVLPAGQQYAFEYYYPGSFDDSLFVGFSMKTSKGDTMVKNLIKDILARLLVKSWAENERNLLLDIRNIMQDADFKITGNDRILNAKNRWVDQLDTEILQLQNKLAWNIRFMGGSGYIGRG